MLDQSKVVVTNTTPLIALIALINGYAVRHTSASSYQINSKNQLGA